MFTMPTWLIWISIGIGTVGTGLFVWMLIAVIRYGPWAMVKKVDQPEPTAQSPAS
jgi:hypothetical protein